MQSYFLRRRLCILCDTEATNLMDDDEDATILASMSIPSDADGDDGDEASRTEMILAIVLVHVLLWCCALACTAVFCPPSSPRQQRDATAADDANATATAGKHKMSLEERTDYLMRRLASQQVLWDENIAGSGGANLEKKIMKVRHGGVDDDEDTCCSSDEEQEICRRDDSHNHAKGLLTCAICLLEEGEDEDGDGVFVRGSSQNTKGAADDTTVCPHIFHRKCIFQWLLLHHDECPCCRRNFLGSLPPNDEGDAETGGEDVATTCSSNSLATTNSSTRTSPTADDDTTLP